jgi:hypothetical protein
MANDTTIKPSSLEKFNLSFEYDMTWQDAKKAIRRRADTK